MKTKYFHLLFLISCIALSFSCQNNPQSSSTGKIHTADVIVYGGTSSAVIAAAQVVKMGKSVILVSPDKHLGGLTAGGLGWTDTGNKAVIGGLAREFYHRLYLHYQDDSAWKWQKKRIWKQGPGKRGH